MGLCASVPIRKKGSEIFDSFLAMDPEVQRLVIGQLMVIVVPVVILWLVWIKMLGK